MEKISHLWKQASVPFEKQFNIRLVVDRIVFPDDPEASGFSFSRLCDSTGGFDFDTALFIVSNFRAKKFGQHTAGWMFVTGCRSKKEGWTKYGLAGGSVMGIRTHKYNGGTMRFGGMKATTVRSIAHEIGHMMGANHTFEQPHTMSKRNPAGKDGLMDYGNPVWNGEVQFHMMHDREMCDVVKRLIQRNGGYDRTPYSEIWVSDPESTPPTAPDAPTTPLIPPEPPFTLPIAICAGILAFVVLVGCFIWIACRFTELKNKLTAPKVVSSNVKTQKRVPAGSAKAAKPRKEKSNPTKGKRSAKQ